MNAVTVIIGAGRSGTNLLRDILCRLPGWGTWPCDEINYIWRHGNRSEPTDEFSRSMARPEVRKYIQHQFAKCQNERELDVVVEKTCANSLRVGFVDEVLPEARFVHLIRDGRDVAVSAAERWKAPLDIPYLAKKVRFVPPSDFPYYATNYARNRLEKLRSKDASLSWWGPKCEGMEQWRKGESIEVMCALQWERCVQLSSQQLKEIDQERQHLIHYEDFVQNPAPVLSELLEFLGVDQFDSNVAALAKGISPKSVGRWKDKLSDEIHRKMESKVGDTLTQFGYKRQF